MREDLIGSILYYGVVIWLLASVGLVGLLCTGIMPAFVSSVGKAFVTILREGKYRE